MVSIMDSRTLIKLIKADGWYLVHTVGSHQQYRHPTKPGKVTVPSLDERRREDDLRLLAAFTHHPPAHLHVEQLIDPPDLDVRVEFGGVERHDDGVQLLDHQETRAQRHPLICAVAAAA